MNIAPFQAAVNEHFPGARVLDVERLSGGVSADTYKIVLSQRGGSEHTCVMRVHGETHSGHAADLEFRLLESLAHTSLPVPAPLVADTSRRFFDYDFVIIEFAAGTTKLDPGQLPARIDAMARMLAKIHQTPTDGIPNLPSRNDPVPELFDFLPADAEWDWLRKCLEHIGKSGYMGKPALLHGDYWPENLLWVGDAITAVLDWEDAGIGDPLSDVACCQLELRYRFGSEVMGQFAEAYVAYAPIDPERLTLWQIYVSAAAQKYMGQWGLEAELEAHMRAEALNTIRESGNALMTSHT